jgi:alkanesulfonate monooxygenase SsuD/methylene tetrahydromethanopterin reductase-like flavin-dependent oxidoreductase (luciferase family)
MIELGIGFPSMFPDVTGEQLLSWAQRADEAGFSSLSSGERVAFGNHDLLMTMAAAGAVTRRIRLMTTVLAAPLHNATMLAKQAASLDRMTGGRFVLGVGISERPDDFAAAGIPYAGRGAVFEQQLVQMQRIWRGEQPYPGVPGVGPVPATAGGPQLLVGAFAPKALARAGRLADGLISFHFTPEPSVQREAYDQVVDAWQVAQRPGRPYWAAGTYFALGPDAPAKAEQWLRNYYGYLSQETQDWFVQSVTTTSPGAIRKTIDTFAEAGADEIYFSPMIPDVDQVDRLAELL